MELLGYFGFKYAKQNKPVATPSPTETSDPTANWKTYTNQLAELSFKYPPTVNLKEAATSVNFTDSSGDFQFAVSWISTVSIVPLEQYLTTRDQCPSDVADGFTSGPIPGSLRCDFSRSHYTSIDIWVMSGTIIYKAQVGAINPNTPIPQEDIDLLNEIISTFKFLAPIPTCVPRPACLDSNPRCLIPETTNMCPPPTPKP